MEDVFKQYTEAIGEDTLEAVIEDGKFIITPSDAGIALLSFVQLGNEMLDEKDKQILKLTNELEGEKTYTANIITNVENIIEKLNEQGLTDLASEVLDTLYAITVVDFEGNTITIDTIDLGDTE